MNEPSRAREPANRILDRNFADPDDDLAVLARQLLRREELLRLLLDNIDHIEGACRLNDPVGACLPSEVLRAARESLGRT